jgi:hypothetical protein
MSEKQNKPLVIKVAPGSIPGGMPAKWNDLTDQMPTFTKDIITPEFDLESGNIGQVISGMPSVFSRANLFKLALDYISDEKEKTDGLLKFYESLIDEWRGLIACIALDYPSISVERISLTYTDGRQKESTSNLYEPKGAFGNALFERQPLWALQGSSKNTRTEPFIDVITYKGTVIGATSPESILFTSVAYKLKEDSPWVSVKSKRLTDPIKSDLTPEDLKQLYGYVSWIENKINGFASYYKQLPKNLRPDASCLIGAFENWKKAIEAKATEKGIDLDNAGAPPVEIFQEPFSMLFNHSDKLFGVEGNIYDSQEVDANAIAFNSKDLLLPAQSEVTQFNFGNKAAQSPDFIGRQPIHVLRAETQGMPGFFHYFALPLSLKGLNVFGKSIDGLLNPNTSAQNSSISAIFDPSKTKSNLSVTLKLVTAQGRQMAPIEEVYTVSKNIVLGNEILIWPDFISKQWGRYFMYSEIPHNQSSVSATPFLMDTEDEYSRALMSVQDGKSQPVYLSKQGEITIPEDLRDRIQAKLHVISDNRVAGNAYQYEIYESSEPFMGLKFQASGKDSGFILIRYSVDPKENIPENDLQRNPKLEKAYLGVDFGSTNTSIAYFSDQTTRTELIQFKNRRVSLFSDDNNDNSVNVANENEIFFFQNDEIKSNEIKSMLTLHDELRMPPLGPNTLKRDVLNQAVVGGFPNFEKNLPINAATDNRYKLSFSKSGGADVVYNMKWSEDEIERAHKGAFISSLLLQVYAELFKANHMPVSLKWSLPSAMGDVQYRHYNNLWSQVNKVNPLKVEDSDLLVYQMNPKYNATKQSKGWDSQSSANQNSDWGNSSATPQSSVDWRSDQPSTSGWGNSDSSVGGSSWGQESESLDINSGVNIELPSGPKTYKFVPISSDQCLTEATAVANYWANNQEAGINPKKLTLSFDIGGSTTDISALVAAGQSIVLVKQHSIRFAAQRISQATRHSKNFESVLLTACKNNDLQIQGLNVEPKKYSPETSSYYFEQIVDRLNVDQLKEFYALLSSHCPELMSVNLYVTGLIAFYAGQLTVKMIEEIKTSNELPQDASWRPEVQVVFAGKGARIFEWFGSVNGSEADKYYLDLFIAGMGGMEVAGPLLGGKPEFNSPETRAPESEIKCEVAKGLAYRTESMAVPSNNDVMEILGEEGFVLMNNNGEEIPLGAGTEITTQMMEQMGRQLIYSPKGDKFPMFRQFGQIFHGYATQFFGFKMTPQQFLQALDSLKIDSYIRSMPEFRLAQKNKSEGEFDFVAPVIILEGMKFYEAHLIKNLS